MNPIRLFVIAALAAAGAVAVAQPVSGRDTGPCPMHPGARAMDHCTPGMMDGVGRHARWGSDYTPGWSMMSPEERRMHRERLASLRTYEECKAYMDKHREEMAERARLRGLPMPRPPRRDACASL